LGFVTRELRGMRLLLVGTYRTTEIDERPGLTESLARAARRVQLRGLDPKEIRRVMKDTAGVAPAPGLIADIHRITEGNPFFIGECVRMLEAEGALGSPDLASLPVKLPAELRATIRRRLAPLPPDERQLLDTAAVVGRDFDVVLLQVACDLPRERALEQLGPAVPARVLEGHPGT